MNWSYFLKLNKMGNIKFWLFLTIFSNEQYGEIAYKNYSFHEL
jgi:hypothetical protein